MIKDIKAGKFDGHIAAVVNAGPCVGNAYTAAVLLLRGRYLAGRRMTLPEAKAAARRCLDVHAPGGYMTGRGLTRSLAPALREAGVAR